MADGDPREAASARGHPAPADGEQTARGEAAPARGHPAPADGEQTTRGEAAPARGRPGPADGVQTGDDLSYEAARDALTEIVTRLEAGSLTLEESLALWERGEALVEVCQARLDGARSRLEARNRSAAADNDRDEEEQ